MSWVPVMQQQPQACMHTQLPDSRPWPVASSEFPRQTNVKSRGPLRGRKQADLWQYHQWHFVNENGNSSGSRIGLLFNTETRHRKRQGGKKVLSGVLQLSDSYSISAGCRVWRVLDLMLDKSQGSGDSATTGVHSECGHRHFIFSVLRFSLTVFKQCTCWQQVSLCMRIESWAWWYIPVSPVLGKQRQKDQEFKTSLGYIVISKPAWSPWNPVWIQREETGWGKGRRKRKEMEGKRGTEKAREQERECIEIQIGSRNTGAIILYSKSTN